MSGQEINAFFRMSLYLSAKQKTMHSRKRARYDDNEDRKTTSLIHLSQDELSVILSFLTSSGKLMLACTCLSLYSYIEQMVCEQSPTGGSMAEVWRKMDRWVINRQSFDRDYDELKKILLKTLSFTNVTNYLCYFVECLRKRNYTELFKELLSIETGNGNRTVQVTDYQHIITSKIVPDVVGFSLRRLEISLRDVFHWEALVNCNQITSLIIHADSISVESQEETKQAFPLFSNLKYLKLDCEINKIASQCLASLIPNVQVLILQQECELMDFVDHCHKLHTLEVLIDETGCELNDNDVLYILKQLPLLKHLYIHSPKITGEVFLQMGAYAQKLEYLCFERVSISGCEQVLTDIKLGGGQLCSLKELHFIGDLDKQVLDQEYDIDADALFDSIINSCPNIQFINIYDYTMSISLCTRNLYGIVQSSQIKELILYPYRTMVNKGRNATDVLTDMTTGWEQIAYSTSVETVILQQAPKMNVLTRCSWPSVRNLNLLNDMEEWDRFISSDGQIDEWLRCLAKACPNIEFLSYKSNARFKEVMINVLSDRKIWPNLKCLRVSNKRILRAKVITDTWSEKWLQNEECDTWQLSYHAVTEPFLRGNEGSFNP